MPKQYSSAQFDAARAFTNVKCPAPGHCTCGSINTGHCPLLLPDPPEPKVYFAAPISAYRSDRYDHLFAIAESIYADATLLSPRDLFKSREHWLAGKPVSYLDDYGRPNARERFTLSQPNEEDWCRYARVQVIPAISASAGALPHAERQLLNSRSSHAVGRVIKREKRLARAALRRHR